MRQRLWILLLAAFLLIGCRGAEAGENEDAMLEDELIRIDEENKAKDLVEQDFEHRDHVNINITGITKL